MKVIVLVLFAFNISLLQAQINWEQRYGALASEYAYSLLYGDDGTYWIGAFSCSPPSGDKEEDTRGDYDFWLVKTNADGDLLWEKTIGGEKSDLLIEVQQSASGKLVLAGSSASAALSGDFINGTYGDFDYKLVIMPDTGTIEADYSIGGTGPDFLNTILMVDENCWFLGGYSRSGIGGSKLVDSLGGYDYWLVKTDSLGVIQDQRVYGGGGDDFLMEVVPTADGHFLLIGWSTSEPGPFKSSAHYGGGDYWVIKIDIDGNKIWETTLGGEQKDMAVVGLVLADSCILIGGYSESTSLGVGNKESENIGGRDFWVVKLDNGGNKLWDKSYGGVEDEEMNAMAATCGKQVYLAGTSRSFTSYDKGDYWVVKIKEDGTLVSDFKLGGPKEDIATALVPFEDDFTLLGFTDSQNGIGIASSSRGMSDVSMVQVRDTTTAACNLLYEIPVKAGWNLISSYAFPINPDMWDILIPLEEEIIILKNSIGAVVVPDSQDSINTVGNWVVEEGYHVKATKDTLIAFRGLKVDPQETPIAILIGWQIIAYLKERPALLADELAGIEDAIIMVKNNEGEVFIPGLVSDLDTLKPGQGYWLKASSNTTLTYSASFGEPGGEISLLSPNNPSTYPQHFILDLDNTGNNATLVIPAEAVGEVLETGDEVGVFSSTGRLCGAAHFEGNNLAVAIWGDDPTTSGVVESISEGELFSLKIWQAVTNQEKTVEMVLEEGLPVYEVNGIYFLSALTPVTTVKDVDLEYEFDYYPNPAQKTLHLRLELKEATRIRVELSSVEGKQVQILIEDRLPAGDHAFQYDISQFSDGLYQLQLFTNESSWIYKLAIQK